MINRNLVQLLLLGVTALTRRAYASVDLDSDTSTHGISPERQYLYQPLLSSPNEWACLNDSSIVLDISKINDGICDCPDGSDEPGTGACGDVGPSFYCVNEGFVPRYIPQSQVNDGVCDCCDCSDEKLSSAKPFSIKNDCSSLNSVFEKIVEEELRSYENGLASLNALQAENPSEDSSVVIENLFKEIGVLEQDLTANEQRLNRVKEEYFRQLKTDNPLLYDFEQIETEYISEVVNSTFVEIIAMSKAYEELVEILNNLENSYAKSLNDRAVNENVKKFNFMKNQKLKRLNIDSKVEEDQRLELLHFFKEELPTTFMEGKIEQSPTYLVGKMSFVDALVIKRPEYTKIVVGMIGMLSNVMKDITENHNVNYQDSAVKQAVELYKNWLAQYASLKVIVLPVEFLTHFEELKDFVIANAAHIIARGGSLEQDSLNPTAIGKHIQFLMNKIKGSFKPNLRNQIKEHQSTATQLHEQLEATKSKARSLKKASSDNGLATLQSLVSGEVTPCVQGTISGYTYEICLNRDVYQREVAPPQRTVSLGNFRSLKIENDNTRKDNFMEHLKHKYPDELDLLLELVSEQGGTQDYLFGNLFEMSNGLAIRYEDGSKCWNGPNRSATVFITCGATSEITKVYETSRCNYGIELKSPLGCNPYFNYTPQV